MVHMAVPDGAEVLYLARLHTRLGAQRLGALGVRFPAHVTGSGKVIAAFDADVATACRARGFPALTTSSIRSASDFDRALDEVRCRGFAVNDQETVSGWTSVAAAVKDHAGKPQAAVSLVGPSNLAKRHIDSQARLVTVAATHLARMLGY
jgi:DNA-binding IclR family transcriptional regulator